MTPNVENHAKVTALFGKRVRVTLVKGDDGSKAIISEGKFLGFNGDGSVEILEDDFCVHYCWPMLDIEEAT